MFCGTCIMQAWCVWYTWRRGEWMTKQITARAFQCPECRSLTVPLLDRKDRQAHNVPFHVDHMMNWMLQWVVECRQQIAGVLGEHTMLDLYDRELGKMMWEIWGEDSTIENWQKHDLKWVQWRGMSVRKCWHAGAVRARRLWNILLGIGSTETQTTYWMHWVCSLQMKTEKKRCYLSPLSAGSIQHKPLCREGRLYSYNWRRWKLGQSQDHLCGGEWLCKAVSTNIWALMIPKFHICSSINSCTCMSQLKCGENTNIDILHTGI